MTNKINPVLYYFSLLYFVYIIANDYRYVITSPKLLIIAVLGIVGFIYGYKYTKK